MIDVGKNGRSYGHASILKSLGKHQVTLIPDDKIVSKFAIGNVYFVVIGRKQEWSINADELFES